MQFEWDGEKDQANLRKHHISFEEAATIFDGPVLTVEDDDIDIYGEVRERSYGLLRGVVVVCVVHTARGSRTRIISARKATSNEQKDFNVYLRQALS